MPSSSSVQRARQALADRLREVRLDAGLTGRSLSSAAGWHEAKTSRIEHARVAPSDTDIRTWCKVCEAAGQIPDLIAASHAADSMWTAWRRLERPGLRRAQETVIPLWERTRQFRIYSPCLIPGPVQTAGYIQALLQAIRERRAMRIDDISDAVRVRVAKQHVTRETHRRFTILLEESALRHRIGGPEILREQLRYLLEAACLPTVALGIIPFRADRSPLRPVEMFFLFDDTEVTIELVSGWLRITEPTEVAMYAGVFTKLTAMAVYGEDATRLITAALDDLK
jgi:transcriptional regulator with XRE-family HTH domain